MNPQLSPLWADRDRMRACAECQFLMDDDEVVCKFCGTAVDRSEPQTRVANSGLPYVDASAPRRVETVSTKVTAGVIVVASVLVAGVGFWSFAGDEAPAPVTPRVTAVAAPTTAPVATTTTGITSLTTTSIPPKSALTGRTVPIGMNGLFTATMPAGTTKVSGDSRSTIWGATLPGGSSITFKAQTTASVADRYKSSVGRIDVSKYGPRVNVDLGVTGTPPRYGAFPTGSGAEWDTSAAGRTGRVTLIDGGSMAYLLVLQHSGRLPVDDIAAYLAVSASLRPA